MNFNHQKYYKKKIKNKIKVKKKIKNKIKVKKKIKNKIKVKKKIIFIKLKLVITQIGLRE